MHSALCRSITAVLMVLFCTTLASGQSDPQVPDQDPAERVLDLLLDIGDRQGALDLALDTLTADPDATPALMSALARVVGHRGLHIPPGTEADIHLSPDGRRAIVSRRVVGAVSPQTPLQVHLHDAVTGMPIGDPIVSTGQVELSRPAAADIDIAAEAGLFLVYLWSDGVAHLHRLEDGARVATFDAVFGIDVQLSPDGRHIAIATPPAQVQGEGGLQAVPARIDLRRVADGALQRQIDLPDASAFDWASPTEIAVAAVDRRDPTAPVTTLLRFDLDTGEDVLAEALSIAPWAVTAAPEGQAFVLQDATRVQVLGPEGQARFSQTLPAGIAVLARDGTALAIPSYGGDRLRDLTLSLVDLDGAPLPTQPEDYLLFDAFGYGPEDQILGRPSLFRRNGGAWTGPDLPQGADLVAAARALAETAMPFGLAPRDAHAWGRAHAADAALAQGDRGAALVAALQAFPDDPPDALFDRLQAAHLMLYRAMAARILVLPEDAPLHAMLDPTGTRMAVGGMAPGLYAMPEATRLADFQRLDGTAPVLADSPAFDPSGRRLALLDAALRAVFLHDGRSGDLLRTIPLPPEAGDGALFMGGFSHDGGLLAVESASAIFVLTVETGRVDTYPAGGIPLWAPGRRQVLVDPVFGPVSDTGAGTGTGPQPVARITLRDGETRTGLFQIVPDPAALRLTPTRASLNRAGTALMLEEGQAPGSRIAVYDGAGALRATTIRSGTPVEFLRGGMAIGTVSGRGAFLGALQIQSLQGEVLRPRIEDFAIFDQGVVTPDGRALLQAPMPSGAPRYRGADLPTGRALWDMAMDTLDPEARAAVAAGRFAPTAP